MWVGDYAATFGVTFTPRSKCCFLVMDNGSIYWLEMVTLSSSFVNAIELFNKTMCNGL